MSELKVDTISPALNSKITITPAVVVQDSVGVAQFEVTSSGETKVLGPLRVGSAVSNTPGNESQVLTSQGTGLPPVWAEGFPFGGIIMWYGLASSIPAGWALCNGQTVNGYTTPDLRDRFVVGAGSSYSVNQTGGVANTTLTTANLPPLPQHTHRLTIAAPDDSNGLAAYGHNTNILYHGSPHELEQKGGPEGARTGYFSVNTGPANFPSSSVTAFTNLPPYYALAFIMRVPTS